jgi:hypothetical protein
MGAMPKKTLRIVLRAPDRETLAKVVKEHRLDVGGGGARRLPDGTVMMEAYVNKEVLEGLTRDKQAFEIIEDLTEVGKQRRKEVGKGDRFEGGKIAPRGLAKKG